jgi:hypothetical protein
MKKVFCFIIIALLVNNAYAGFPIGRGKYLLVPSYNLYTTKGYWDASGTYIPFSNGGRFASHYFGIYGGIGIGERLDFVGNISYIMQRKLETNLTQSNSSFGDATFGLSYLLNTFDYSKFLTVTGSLIVPLYTNDASKQPFTGFQQVGGEVKFTFSGSNGERYSNTYFDINLGVRQFFSPEGPTQLFGDALLGIPLDEDNKLTFQLASTKSTSTQTGLVLNPNNLFLNRQFNYFRLTAGYGRKISQKYQIFFSVFTDVNGRNTGKGGGGAISLVGEL